MQIFPNNFDSSQLTDIKNCFCNTVIQIHVNSLLILLLKLKKKPFELFWEYEIFEEYFPSLQLARIVVFLYIQPILYITICLSVHYNQTLLKPPLPEINPVGLWITWDLTFLDKYSGDAGTVVCDFTFRNNCAKPALTSSTRQSTRTYKTCDHGAKSVVSDLFCSVWRGGIILT